ncbi:MAG: hypothetical protein HYV65_00930 [Candidatus Spechtbacteria bacterium]|nr:hypothetical protein [Candidatus Spechtbacteria bacterium]
MVFRAIFLSITVIFVYGLASPAYAATPFFVDSGYDWRSRDSITATPRYEGNRARYYIDDEYWGSLALSQQQSLIGNISVLSQAYDRDIYNQITRIFGLEWLPGIDNDVKITILLTRMIDDAGGYFLPKDEYPRSQIANSNEREMIYLNVTHLGFPRAKAFLAHELQHLINYNQKTRRYGVEEEVWLNEILSEVTSTLVGFDDEYEGSNLQNRVQALLRQPDDALIDWGGGAKDYGGANLFGHYLYEQYGKELFTRISQSPEVGIEAINDALAGIGAKKQFQDVFTDWVITLLLNDCAIAPQDTYCYKNSNLAADKLRISFSLTTAQNTQKVSFGETTKDWAGNWFLYKAAAITSSQPQDHIFYFTFDGSVPSNFTVPYVVFGTDGSKTIRRMKVADGDGGFAVADFGRLIKEVVIMPINQYTSKGTMGKTAFTRFMMDAQLLNKVPAGVDFFDISAPLPIIGAEDSGTQVKSTKEVEELVFFPEGSLIRAEGRPEVYIVKGQYRRWIQTAELFEMYGNLRWEDIVTVSQEQMDFYTESFVIKLAGDPRVFIAGSDGTKQWIQTEQEFLARGYHWNMIYTVNEKEFDWFK